MSNYSALKTDINNNIYENNTQQITGTILNTVLKDMVNTLGAGYQFAGCAYLDLNPGAPDAKVFYLAGEGLYTNFDNIQVPAGKLGILKWDTRWHLETIEGLGGGGANLTGYISVASTDNLPEVGEPTIGYLCGTNLYLYVGEGGDTKEGKYQNCGGFRGPEGVGITDIEQVEQSTANGGRNTIRIHLSNGSSYDVYTRNGTTSTGLFPTLEALQAAYPSPVVGQYAFVGAGFPADIYVCNTAGTWTDSGADYDGDSVDLTNYATKAELNQLEAEVDGVTTKNYTEGYKVLQSGALEEDAASVVCDKVPVSFGDVLSLNKAYSFLCAYDANDVKLDHWSARASVSLTATADQNVAYVLCSFKIEDLASAYIKKGTTTLWKPESSHTPGLIENVAALEDRAEELETSVENNTEDISTLNVKIDGQEQNYIPGKVMKYSGATEYEPSAFLSENIPVSQGDTIRFHQVYGFLCVFDSEGNRLDYWSDSYNDTDQSLSGATFANAAYMAASFKKTNKATATISKNGVVVFKAKEEVIGINEKLANKEALSIRIPSGGFITQSGTFKETQAGDTYTIFPSQRSWDVSAVSDGQAIFWIETGLRSLYDVRKGSDLAESYEITLQEGEYLRIYVRGTQGQTLSFESVTYDKTQVQTNKEKIADLYHKFAGEDILDLHPAPVMEPILANLQYYKNPYNWQNYGDKPLTLLFFSDLHACSIPLQRIMRFANAYGTYIDDVVCGGDMVNSFTNGFDFWAASGAQKVLPVIGNHEVIGGSPSIDGHAITSYTKHSAKALYEMVVAPFLAQTGITVDEDKCYWYKDYDSCKIRVIALDIYHYNDTITVEGGATYTTYPDGGTSDQGEQATWFADTLAEAKTKNYAVICLRHGPFLFDLMENPFTSMEFQNTTASGLINPANNSVVNMVQDFIDGGGVFLAWMTGHIHQDAVGTVKDFPDQFQMTIDTSRYHYNGIDGTFLPYGSNIKIEGRTKAADCFDIFSVDTYKKNLTLFRIGSEYDRNGRHIGSLVYNYEEKRLIYVE